MSSTPSEYFSYWGVELPYCRVGYNHSGDNERAVEIPVAQCFLAHHAQSLGGGLEIGNVLSHYMRAPWTIVDRYEPGDHLALDLFDYHQQHDWIVSISTLEHIRWDEPDQGRHPDGPVRALEHLFGLLRPGGTMLVTTPMGWHPFWDSAILDGRLPVEPVRQCTFVRHGQRWQQTGQLCHLRYAASTIWAEAVWIGEFVR